VKSESIPHPPIVSAELWMTQRRELLEREKELTRHRDRVHAERRRLPMVKVSKKYTFEGATGKQSLLELFDGRRQLIVYHFMFDPAWDKGCSGCTAYVNALGDLSMLRDRDTTFVVVSRAPLPKLETYRKEEGWDIYWVSSFGSDFNYDFHVTLDQSAGFVEYNYRESAINGEEHGLSVFFRLDNEIFHTWSTYARGTESLTDAYALLDTTPWGRQQDFEDSPPGWPQRPTYGK
jgi:predicted dithiol-disulfide oxidoreductase (DUF899 family)